MVLAILSICLIGAGHGPGSGWAARNRGTLRDRLTDRIDRLLPQTQCGKCNFKGCRPYAEAIAAGQAEINQCPPGGAAGIRALARLLGREPLPLNPENGVEKPAAVAVIDEQACIGCTLCIQACPVDAILGAMKQMHTVIADECTGCELCIPPCPVDCIVMQDKPVEPARSAGERLFHFHGGLRLPHNKQSSCETPIQTVAIPPRLYVSLLQHDGPEARPLVQPGTRVLKGEPLACFDLPSTGYVHAPTSGIVTAIARQAISHPSGLHGSCIVLKPDGLDQWTQLQPIEHWQSVDAEVIRQRLSVSGIAGAGGILFPASTEVDGAGEPGIQTLILNGTECEPYISCDEMLMREQADRIVLGALILQKAVAAETVIIAIEDRVGDLSGILQTAISKSGGEGAGLVKAEEILPEGGEKQLVRVLSGQEIPDGLRPPDRSVLSQGVAIAAAAAEAVMEGKPFVQRVVTVTGNGVKQPRNLLALIGTPISNLVDACGGYTQDAARLVMGGPMTGYALDSDQNPVIKATNCILVLSGRDIQSEQVEMPCIRCGECARVCPAMLLPQLLNSQIRNGLLDDAADSGLGKCIECGCCDSVCPSHIPLAQWFRFGKSEHLMASAGRARAEHARNRFLARESRLERLSQERDRRLSEKKQALRDNAIARSEPLGRDES